MSELQKQMQQMEAEQHILSELPPHFNDTLLYHMDSRKITVAQLAERSCLSERQIKRLRADGEAATIQVVLGLCIGLQLEPELSLDLITKAGFVFRKTDEHLRYQFVLRHMNHDPIDFVNRMLHLYHARPIGSREEHGSA